MQTNACEVHIHTLIPGHFQCVPGYIRDTVRPSNLIMLSLSCLFQRL